MTTDDHRKLLDVDELPPSVRQIIEDYEATIQHYRNLVAVARTRAEHQEKRLRIAKATITLLRGIIEGDKHLEAMRKKLKRKGVNPDTPDDGIRYDIIENSVTYGGPGYDTRTIHEGVTREFLGEFVTSHKLKKGKPPFNDSYTTDVDSMGCSKWYVFQVAKM